MVFAVQKWRHYLLPNHFVIKTDHSSLKYILEQKLSTVFQQKWLVKLMEFDFSIEYRQGKENMVAYALSRVEPVECQALITRQIQFVLLERIKLTWSTDPHLQKLISYLQHSAASHKHYSWLNDELKRKGKLVMGQDPTLIHDLLTWLHTSVVGGHSSRNATWQRVRSVLYWKGLFRDIKLFIQ